MKKHVTKISLALSLLCLSVSGQEGRIQPCNTYAAMEQAFSENPGAKQRYDDIHRILDAQQVELERSGAAKSAAAFEYTVPVVFHILYTCGGQTIADSVCFNA